MRRGEMIEKAIHGETGPRTDRIGTIERSLVSLGGL